ncbi:MAG: diguanylate cyclase, partial [Pseudomonadota bacterium]
CRRLKADPETSHIPVVMVTALDQQSDRVAGLEAGADDFLTKPVEDLALFARVRGLSRLKIMTDELRRRFETGQDFGLLEHVASEDEPTRRGSVAVVADDLFEFEALETVLSAEFDLTSYQELDPHLSSLRGGGHDVIILDLGLESADSLRLVSQLRSFEDSRFTPVLGLVRDGDLRRLVRALDMGVNDYIARPIDGNELVARMRTQFRRTQSLEQMRAAYHKSLEMAVTDPLTGLHNRRYLSTQMEGLVAEAKKEGSDLSVLVIDIDHFKAINDEHGHDAGDEVLRVFGRSLAASVRGVDLACRYGGEEFVVAMPRTNKEAALIAAERFRADAEALRVKHDDGEPIRFTISVGVASVAPVEDEIDARGASVVTRADQALLAAKRSGRNKYVFADNKSEGEAA